MKDREQMIQEIQAIEVSQIPSVIQEQFRGLSSFKEKVDVAVKKADSAVKSAQTAYEQPAGLFQKQVAIEKTQAAVADLAKAQVSAMDAQKVSFAYQKMLSDAMKYLFALGVSSLAANRSVIRQLELTLHQASAEELDELARQEILSVIKQLKAQEDILKKLDTLGDRAKELNLRLKNCEAQDVVQDRRICALEAQSKGSASNIAKNMQKTLAQEKRIAEGETQNQRQDDEIARLTAVDAEQEKRILEVEAQDRRQDDEIVRLTTVDKELKNHIAEVEVRNQRQDEEITRQATIDNELKGQLDELEQKYLTLQKESERNYATIQLLESEHQKSVLDISNKSSKLAGIISLVISSAALILSILHFFI